MEFKVFDLGLVDYKNAWQFQNKLFMHVKNGLLKSAMILCQHYPVVTLGRLANKRNILVTEYELKSRGIQMYESQRGGDVTYHGPGQLVVYPIFNLSYFKKDIHLFLRQLEEVVIDLLSDFGIRAIRCLGLTGVWIERHRDKDIDIDKTGLLPCDEILWKYRKGQDKQKIASIGIAIKNWITFHGLSINIKKDDLDNFRLIRPCGMDIEMTSLETILGRDIEIDNLKGSLIHKFSYIFYNQPTATSV